MGGVALRQNRLLDRALAAWRWWLEELGQIVPRPVREAFAAPNDAFLIEVQPAELIVARRAGAYETVIARIPRDEFALRTLRLSIPRTGGIAAWFADPVILQMPADDALERPLRLPRGAARDLPDLLRHEVARQSPLAAQDIYYDYRVEAVEDTALDVSLRIVRRDPVDACVTLCREAGIALSAIEFVGDDAHADGGTFPADPGEARKLRLAPKIVPALAGLVLLLAAGALASLYFRGEAIAGDLADRVEAARGRATVVETLERRLDAANRQATFLAEQKRNPASVAVLATVARLLPDGAWLYEFELNGDEVRLHGFSSSAASLIGVFDASPYFAEAQFRAPLMQGPSPNIQRFDLSFKLRKAGT